MHPPLQSVCRVRELPRGAVPRPRRAGLRRPLLRLPALLQVVHVRQVLQVEAPPDDGKRANQEVLVRMCGANHVTEGCDQQIVNGQWIDRNVHSDPLPVGHRLIAQNNPPVRDLVYEWMWNVS